MRAYAIVCLSMLLEAATYATTPAPATRPLRFVTFNVLHGGIGSGLFGNGDHLDDRLTIAADELKQLDADVIGLQEASVGWRRGDVTARLATAIGYEHHVQSGALSWTFGSPVLGWLTSTVLALDEGPAIISRHPIGETRSWVLDRCGAFFNRVLLCAEIRTPHGPLEACSTHLNGTACQARSVQRHLHEFAGTMPIVLMGDFNATETDPSLKVLREGTGLLDTFRVANPTLPGATDWQEVYAPEPTADERIDYVLFGPQRQGVGKVVDSRVVLDQPEPDEDGDPLWPSDHYGVLSDVDPFAGG